MLTRRLAALVTTLLTVTGLSLVGGPAQASVTQNTGCGQVTVIGDRGSGQTSGFGPQVSASVHAAFQALPAATTVQYKPVDYTAVAINVHLTPTKYVSSVMDGIANTMKTIDATLKACPQTKLVLVGYSQGAEVIHTVAFVKLTAAQLKHVATVVLIADPIRNLSDPGVFDWYYGATNMASKTGIIGAGAKAPAVLTHKVITFCNASDAVCAPPTPITDMLKAVHVLEQHSAFYTKHAAETGKMMRLPLKVGGILK